MTDYREALKQFQELPHNWNSYGGKPTTALAAKTLLRVVECLLSPELPDGQIVPLADGGVQLEWHLGGIDAELWVEFDGHVLAWAAQGNSERLWEYESCVPLFNKWLLEHLDAGGVRRVRGGGGNERDQ